MSHSLGIVDYMRRFTGGVQEHGSWQKRAMRGWALGEVLDWGCMSLLIPSSDGSEQPRPVVHWMYEGKVVGWMYEGKVVEDTGRVTETVDGVLGLLKERYGSNGGIGSLRANPHAETGSRGGSVGPLPGHGGGKAMGGCYPGGGVGMVLGCSANTGRRACSAFGVYSP